MAVFLPNSERNSNNTIHFNVQAKIDSIPHTFWEIQFSGRVTLTFRDHLFTSILGDLYLNTYQNWDQKRFRLWQMSFFLPQCNSLTRLQRKLKACFTAFSLQIFLALKILKINRYFFFLRDLRFSTHNIQGITTLDSYFPNSVLS